MPAGAVRYAMQRAENRNAEGGLRRDLLYCFDLYLPESFTPHTNDGEVVQFTLLPLAEAMRLVAETDDFKFNVNLVLIDLFLRRGLIDPSTREGQELRRRLNGANEP